jgi:predicted alpha/beta superfamily hydrolase
VVIVAIGYPIETPLDGDRRYYDLTPKTDISSFRQRLGRDVVTGGRDEFLDFIVSQVRPLVASRYPVDPQRQTLFGHSLGGQFVLHAMFTRPGLFQTYVAGSPSIWWNERSLLQELEAFAAMPAETRNDLTLRIIVGADELGHILIDARNLVVKLPPMRVYYQEIDDESHVSMLPAAINSALRFALKPPHP